MRLTSRLPAALRPPVPLLARLRWFFLLFGLFFVVTFLPQMLAESDRPLAWRMAGALSLVALGLWWLRCYRRGRFPLPGLLIEAAAFAMCVLTPDDPYKALGLLYISVNFRALYGTWRQALGFTAMAILTFGGAVVLAAETGAVDRVALLAQSIPGVPVLAVIAHLVAVASERGERATAREHVLSRSGLAIAVATDPDDVRREGLVAVAALVADVAGATATIQLDTNEPPPPAGARLVLPLRTGEGTIGSLRVDSPAELPVEVGDALEALSAQLALGLQNAALTADLRHRATHDSLTDLGNRDLVDDCIRAALEADTGSTVAVLLLDLDGFKQVNDVLGHAAGDALLMAVAERLRVVVRKEDVVARVGGDEFVVLLNSPTAVQDAPGLARRIAAAISVPVPLNGRDVSVGVSVGVAVAGPGATPDALLREADAEMYVAKQGGRDREAHRSEPATSDAPRDRFPGEDRRRARGAPAPTGNPATREPDEEALVPRGR